MKKFKFYLCALSMSILLTGCQKVDIGWSWNFEDVKNFFIRDIRTEQDIVSGLEEISSQTNNSGVGSEFVFISKDVKTKPGLGVKSKYVNQVYLYLDNGIYYPVDIPTGVDYVTDNSKYIYAKDGSLSVSVVTGLDIYEFSKAAFIEHAESLAPNVIATKMGVKGPQEAAVHIADDKTVVVRCFDSPDTYETILFGLLHNLYYVSEYNCIEKDNLVTKELSNLPQYKDYQMKVYAGLGDDIQKIYTFNDGTLTISKEIRQFKDACTKLGTKLAVIADDNIARTIYSSDTIYYVEINDYTLGVYNLNYNTCFTLFGSGKEARYNIVAFLNAQ